ncbi:MAG: glycerophosphoryl diester phosphodiesterase membrane domain-containing protein [Lachnospiraceae bacterium]|nr:glycerophosphoryl diester phosphodiesterase membrane domain-containing protein [Lachnospiraceae bacterium]
MKTFKKSFDMFKYNFPSILLFEVMYKLLSAVILIPSLYTIINFSVKLSGVRFLSLSRLKRYLMAPTTYIAWIIIILLVLMYFLINMSAIIYAMDASHRKVKTNALQILLRGVVNGLRLLKPKNFLTVIDVLFVIPWIYSAVIISSILELKFPDYFYVFISSYKSSFIMVCVAYFLLCILATSRIFLLNYYVVYRASHKKSIELSRRTVKKHFIKIIGGIILYNLFLAFAMILLEGLIAGGFAAIMSKILAYKQMRFIFGTVVNIVILIIYMVLVTVSTPFIFSYICTCFYQNEEYEEIYYVKEKTDKYYDAKYKKKNKKISAVIILISILINGVYVYLNVKNYVSLNVAHPNRVDVTAHRGDSRNAPENTMASFRLAVENQADSIELDVRQTKDGEYIVIHDENLKRTTGVNNIVGNVDLEYIKSLDAGSFFSEEYEGEQIPTLREALEFAVAEDVFLNIELKPADTDRDDYVEGIISMLEEFDYFDNCVIASSDYDTLKKVKEINSDLFTVYILYAAYGEIGDMENVDAFSIQHSFVSARLVRDIHKNGKKIYAWTVDKESKIKDLLFLDVDVIITNDPYTTKEIVYNANDSLLSDWFRRLVKEY